MPADMTLQQQLVQIFRGMAQSAITMVPRILTAIVLVVIMVLVAKVLERLLRSMLVRVRFDAQLGQVGVDKILQRVGIRQSLSHVLPRLGYYLLLFLFARIGADVLGLTAVSEAITSIFGYFPNVVAAILVFVVGSSVAQFIGQAVTQAADDAGIDFAKSLGGAVSGLILFVVAIMALAQLKIDTDMVRLVTTCILGGIALAFGLSFGLGTRDITRNVLAGFYARKIFQPGDSIEIRGLRGVLRSITATQTLVEHEGGVISFANSAFLDETVRS